MLTVRRSNTPNRRNRAPSEIGYIRAARPIGKKSTSTIIDVANEILDLIDDKKVIRRRPPYTFAVTLLGSQTVRAVIENGGQFDGSLFDNELGKLMPDSTRFGLYGVPINGVVALGRGKFKSLALRLDSRAVTEECRTAANLLVAHTGINPKTIRSLNRHPIPHVTFAQVRLDSLPPKLPKTPKTKIDLKPMEIY